MKLSHARLRFPARGSAKRRCARAAGSAFAGHRRESAGFPETLACPRALTAGVREAPMQEIA